VSGRTKLILALVGIFLAGTIAGAAIMFGVGRRVQQVRATPEQWTPLMLERMTGELALTPEQRDVLKPILQRGTDEVRLLRQASMRQTVEILARVEREVGEHLTPEQKQRYDQLREERRERFRRITERGDFPRRHREGERPAPDGPRPPPHEPRP
jgi:Spy/CpxP family protein refolding chaperone